MKHNNDLSTLDALISEYWALAGSDEHYLAAKRALHAIGDTLQDLAQPSEWGPVNHTAIVNEHGMELHADELAVTIGQDDVALATFAWPDDGEYAVMQRTTTPQPAMPNELERAVAVTMEAARMLNEGGSQPAPAAMTLTHDELEAIANIWLRAKLLYLAEEARNGATRAELQSAELPHYYKVVGSLLRRAIPQPATSEGE